MSARWCLGLVVGVLASVALSACSTASTSSPREIFGAIEGIASSGNYLWVASQTGTTSRSDVELTELNATTGRLIRIIPAKGYNLHFPLAIAATGGDLWVSYSTAQGSIPIGPGAVAEIQDTTGRKLRLFHVGGDLMEVPTAMAVEGEHLWLLSSQCAYCGYTGVLVEVNTSTGRVERVANPEGTPSGLALTPGVVWVPGGDVDGEGINGGADNAVTEVSQTTGSVVRVVRLRSGVRLDGGGYLGCGSSGIAASRADVWVADSYCEPVPDGSAAEIGASTGRIVRGARNAYSYYGGLTGPLGVSVAAVAIARGSVWLADEYGGWADRGVVVELNASTGRVILVRGGRRDAFDQPDSITIVDDEVWIASPMSLTELDERTGDVVRTVPASVKTSS